MPTRDLEIEIAPKLGGTVEIIGRNPGGATVRAELDLTSLLALAGAPQARHRQLAALCLPTRDLTRRRAAGAPVSAEDLGDELFHALFPGQIRTLLHQARREAEVRGALLRIRLNIRSPALALLPWELICERSKHLALTKGLAVVRSPEQPQDLALVAAASPLRILAVAASPSRLSHLDLAREERSLRQALSPLERQGKAALEWHGDIDPQALAAALAGGGFHVFHSPGTGTSIAGWTGDPSLSPAPMATPRTCPRTAWGRCSRTPGSSSPS